MSNFLDDYVEVLKERHDELDGKKYEGEVIDVNKKIISFSGVPSLEEVDDELNILQEQMANAEPQDKIEKYQLFSQMKLVRTQVEKVEKIEQEKQEMYELITYYQNQIENEEGDLETNQEAIEKCKQRINELNTQEKELYNALGREKSVKDFEKSEIEENEEETEQEENKESENEEEKEEEKEEENKIEDDEIEESQDNKELTNEEIIDKLNRKLDVRDYIKTLKDFNEASYYLLSKQGKTEQELQSYLDQKDIEAEELEEIDAEIEELSEKIGDKIPQEIKEKIESIKLKENEQQDIQSSDNVELNEKLAQKEEQENILKYYKGLRLENEAKYNYGEMTKEEFEQEQDLLEQSIEKVEESLQEINKQIEDLLPKKEQQQKRAQPTVDIETLQNEISGLENMKEYYRKIIEQNPDKEGQYSKYIERFDQDIAKNREMMQNKLDRYNEMKERYEGYKESQPENEEYYNKFIDKFDKKINEIQNNIDEINQEEPEITELDEQLEIDEEPEIEEEPEVNNLDEEQNELENMSTEELQEQYDKMLDEYRYGAHMANGMEADDSFDPQRMQKVKDELAKRKEQEQQLEEQNELENMSTEELQEQYDKMLDEYRYGAHMANGMEADDSFDPQRMQKVKDELARRREQETEEPQTEEEQVAEEPQTEEEYEAAEDYYNLYDEIQNDDTPANPIQDQMDEYNRAEDEYNMKIDNIIESCKEQGIELKDVQERINEMTAQKETNQYKEKDDDGR